MPTAILHLLSSAQLEETGPARIVAALAAGLDPEKYQVHAWFLGPRGPLIEDLKNAGAITRSINWSSGVFDPVGAFRFWRCLRKCNFAIVHHHFGGRAVRRIIRLSSNARVIVHLHARIPLHDSNRRVPIAVRGADTVIAVSRAVALQAPNAHPLVVYAGVESKNALPAEQKAHKETIVIGAAGRLVDIKGFLFLIRAFALLHSEFPVLQLEFAGTGPDQESLEREVARLGLTGCVRFLGWQRNLGPVFRSWDIFAMPSLTEGLPMAALEAMAEGLPIIASNVGGLPELVETGLTGYLVPPSNVEALAESLRHLILDPKRRQAMGAAGQNRARKHFSVDRMIAQFASIYDSLTPSGNEPEDRALHKVTGLH